MGLHNIKLALFSYSYHLAFGAHDVFSPTKRMTLREFLDVSAEMGLDGIQIDAVHLASRSSDYLDEIRGLAADRGLYIEYGVTGVDESRLRNELEIARRLGASLMRTYLGFNPRRHDVRVGKELEAAVHSLRNVKSIARDAGITIAIENHCDLRTEELIDLIRTIDDPTVGVCVDLGNFMIHLENPVDSVRKLAPYIVGTHFKDYAFSMENWGFKAYGVPLGEGSIDLASILDILIDEAGLDRITLEIPVEKEDSEERTLGKEDVFVRSSVRYARQALKIGRP